MKNRLYLPIVFAAVAVFVHSSFSQVRGRKLFDLMGQKALVKGGYAYGVIWSPDGKNYIKLEKDKKTKEKIFFLVDPVTKTKKVFIKGSVLLSAYNSCTGKSRKRFPYAWFKFNKEGTKISFGSFGGGLFVYDLNSGKMSKFPEISWDGQTPLLSPDWQKIVYTKKFDLYMTDIKTKKEIRLTTGGTEGLRNGKPDWVYPEELFQYQVIWWSPDSRKLAFLRFNESGVTKYPIIHQLKPDAELEEQYYPLAGEKNPYVTMHIIDINTKKIVDVNSGHDKDVYIFSGKWLPDGSKLSYQRLNRRQNKLELLFADPVTGKSDVIISDFDSCYFNINFDLRFIDNNKILWTSERSGWKEIYLYNYKGKLIRQITNYQLPVKSIKSIDEENGWIYFTGHLNNGLDTHLFRIDFNGKNFKKLTYDEGVHSVKLSPFGNYFFDSYSNLKTPPKTLLCKGNGEIIDTVSVADISELNSLKLLPPELVKFKAADKKTDLFGIVFKPADLDTTKKYPLLVYVYGGPWAKLVHNRFQSGGYLQRLAQLGFIVFIMDNRGTTQRGKAFETATYLKCGQTDLDDQAEGVKFLSKRSYVDGQRVGITGSSYGGYMTCMALLRKPDIYHAGVAISSVTDWKNYDTIYTERYMQRPEDNPDGYKKGSALNYAGNLKGKLLLVHGTVDNNVHQSNTIQLIQKLVEAGKEFDLMLYPEQRHGIAGINGQHLMNLTVNYFCKYLKNEEEK